jgi:hypothetical protein
MLFNFGIVIGKFMHHEVLPVDEAYTGFVQIASHRIFSSVSTHLCKSQPL